MIQREITKTGRVSKRNYEDLKQLVNKISDSYLADYKSYDSDIVVDNLTVYPRDGKITIPDGAQYEHYHVSHEFCEDDEYLDLSGCNDYDVIEFTWDLFALTIGEFSIEFRGAGFEFNY